MSILARRQPEPMPDPEPVDPATTRKIAAAMADDLGAYTDSGGDVGLWPSGGKWTDPKSDWYIPPAERRFYRRDADDDRASLRGWLGERPGTHHHPRHPVPAMWRPAEAGGAWRHGRRIRGAGALAAGAAVLRKRLSADRCRLPRRASLRGPNPTATPSPTRRGALALSGSVGRNDHRPRRYSIRASGSSRPTSGGHSTS